MTLGKFFSRKSFSSCFVTMKSWFSHDYFSPFFPVLVGFFSYFFYHFLYNSRHPDMALEKHCTLIECFSLDFRIHLLILILNSHN